MSWRHAGTSGVYANRPRHGVDLRRFLIRFTLTKDRNIQGIDSGGKMGGSHMIATGGIVNAAIPSEDRAFLAPGRRSSVHRLNTATPASLRRSQFTLEDMRHTGHFAPTKPDVVPSLRLFTSFLRNRRNRSPSIVRDSCERRRCPARCSFFQCHPITARFHGLKKLSRRPHGRLSALRISSTSSPTGTTVPDSLSSSGASPRLSFEAGPISGEVRRRK